MTTDPAKDNDGNGAAETTAPTDDTVEQPKAEASEPAAEDPKPEPPARVLPSYEDIAAWAGGAEIKSIGTLFEGLKLARFDAFSAQIRNKEILPQHWQPISAEAAPADEVFDGLPEVGNLRVKYADQEMARRRLGAMKVAWRELRGKRPGLWQVGDLVAALRRIIQKDLDVDFYELLSGARDLWRGMTLPMGKEQVEILWAAIAVIRKGTKK